ncbi:hypothetical protein Afer_1023 [Acidimicrobium ferrooxidans DSM 10331]|uniref:YfhO family protein n=1 Tax=Acidimicrobium ferrooxidans (strain DSM 10331 / JCM 15462 / NBRC 103882 / ICP) TaxID=525909 RepID=C7LZ03_ACIFD|nr:hypothetical protein [Acidimicrobium ferrooxidans]ACU53961.1 hypothetical protein Afer_1023 [Acidimicrobium ferrooxidans DSM 10331]
MDRAALTTTGDAGARRAVVILIVVPIVLFVVPALAGHPLLFGDNATQNAPLRTLVGLDLRHGSWPLWDPAIWSGVPLAAGFNAGAFSPFIIPFIVLPTGLAFSVAAGSAFATIALSGYLSARTLGIGVKVATVAGLVLALTGAAIGQSVHLDMIEGDAGWMLAFVFLARLAYGRSSRLANALGLAAGFALDVLAGAPEAMLAGLVVLAVAAVVWTLGRRLDVRDLVVIAICALEALMLAAIQWVPGLAFTALSTRAHLPPHYAGAGPFSGIFTPLAVYPMAFGGELISYFGNYNPYEINVSITALGLAFLLLAAVRPRASTLRRGAAPALWSAAVLSMLFALGGHTPFAHLVYRLPLFDLQRLASRYLIGVDFAAVLLAAGSADWALAHPDSFRHHLPTRVALIVFGTLAVGFALVEIVAPAALLEHFNVVSLPTGISLAALRGYLVVMAIAVGAATIVLLGSPLRGWALRILVLVLVLDVANQVLEFPLLSSLSPPVRMPTAPTVASLLRRPLRYVVYDPELYLYESLIATDAQPDTNIYAHTLSASGYSSLGLARYDAATGTKPESTFDPADLSTLVRDFNVRLVVTSRRYFATEAPTASRLPASSPLSLRDGRLDVYAGDLTGVTKLTATVASPVRRLAMSVTLTSGATIQAATEHRASSVQLAIPGGETVQSVRLSASKGATLPVRVVAVASSGAYLLGGPLDTALAPSSWHELIVRGAALAFELPEPAHWIEPEQGLRVLDASQAASGTITATVVTTHPTRLVLPFAWAPGWSAQLDGHPAPVGSSPSDQMTVDVGAGRQHLVMSYHAPRFGEGLAASALGLAAWFVGALVLTRRRTKVPTS